VSRRPAWLLVALAVACQSGGTPPGGARSGTSGARLSERALVDRPKLVLVPREGDPSGAVAFATAHAEGSVASVATAAFLAARLAERGFPGIAPRPHALGFTLATLASEPGAARRFVTELIGALDAPPKPGEAALRAAGSAVNALGRHAAPGPAEAWVAACSGEVIPPKAGATWDPTTPAAISELGRWLRMARARTSSSVSALGPASTLQAVESALSSAPAWPEGTATTDAWPVRDELGVDLGPASARRLSVASRIANPNQAILAARVLGRPGGLLERRLAQLRPAWTVERAQATARVRGACIRVDLLPPPGEPGPLPADAARALAVASEELDQALAAPPGHALEEAVLAPTDPREAASAAAWNALSGREGSGVSRRFVSYTAPASERSFDLGGAVAAELEARRRPSLDVRVRNEPGQARALALLGTPCGTGPESAADAGEAALVVMSLSRLKTAPGITFTPIVSADTVGLLAEATRVDAAESLPALGERLGRALGEALAVTRPSASDVAAARDDLVERLSARTRRGYVTTLDAVSQGHPSWLEPRGTLDALGPAPAGGIDAAIARFLGRPLRLAVVTNDQGAQGRVVASTVERLLRPVRGTVTRCPNHAALVPAARELTLVPRGDEVPHNVLGLPFAPFARRPPLEARAAAELLNRPNGLLEAALRDAGASALATLVGGPHAAALVVEIAALAGAERTALERVQALLATLAGGAISNKDVADVQRMLEKRDQAERLDPRFRALELFRGPEPARTLTPGEVAKFFASLRRDAAVLVTVAPRAAP